ncbi:spaetzle-processing enzyme-like [Teleopsis dalmanni]|uniref:spaetzle-processing enzyme-like n=1 Tax=Teleopsis dalmanni TaxID=139649 RepID=UPI0018CE2201|nr:spaetzle-processing enzyme-like [Teleopsis dalmanni]
MKMINWKRLNINIIFLIGIILTICSGINADYDYGACTTPNNESGLCIHIDDCEYLWNMLLNPVNRQESFLAKSQCGYDNTATTPAHRILVCCADKYCNKPKPEANNVPKPGNVLPEAGKCGISLENRILGGQNTSLFEFPWMALIQYKKPNNVYEFHCGGSLINSRYVLTAAHCVRNEKTPGTWEVNKVRLGEWNTTSDPDCVVDINGHKECALPHVDVEVEETIVHENYMWSSRDQYNDIALIRLKEPVQYTGFVEPICLPISSELRSSSFKDQLLDVAGWGVTEKPVASDVKLKINVTTWQIPTCQEKYKTFQITLDENKQLCAGGRQGIDTCNGDSGGPLTIRTRAGNKDVYFAAGIVSYGPKPCGIKNWPGMYTRVGAYVDWIISNLKP